MQKLLLLFIFSITISSSSWAQCVPDTTMTEVVNPPAGSQLTTINGEDAVVLPLAKVGVNYSETLQFKIPRDTSFAFGGFPISATIDSVKLVDMLHLPAALTLSCSPSECVFMGGSHSCAQLTGTPTAPDTIELEVALQLFIRTLGAPSTSIRDTLGGFYLVIEPNETAINENSPKVFAPKVYPNPAKDRLFVQPDVAYGEEFQLQITSVIGRTVYSKTKIKMNDDALELDVSDLKTGIYLYTLSTDGKKYTGRFSISR